MTPENTFMAAIRAAMMVAPIVPCPECGRAKLRAHPACGAYAHVVKAVTAVREQVRVRRGRERVESEFEVRERFPTLAVIQRAYDGVLVDMWKGAG